MKKDISEYIGMRVEEVLPQLDAHIKFGTNYGKKFFCCEHSDNVLRKLEQLDIEHMERFLELKDKYASRIARRAKEIRNIEVFLAADKQNGFEDEIYEENKELLEKLNARQEKDAKSLRYSAERLNKRVPFRRREVVDIAVSMDSDEPNGTLIVIVEGYERGRFWSTKEYTGEVEVHGNQ